MSTGPQAMGSSQKEVVSSDALMSLSKHPHAPSSLGTTHPGCYPFLSLPHPISKPPGGEERITVVDITWQLSENRQKCAFCLLAASKCFWLPNDCVDLPQSSLRRSLSLFLAPGAVQLSQQHGLCGERLLLSLVTRGPRKLWKNRVL